MPLLEPLSIAVLAIEFLAYATLIGNPVRRFLLRPQILEGQASSLAVRLVASLMTGLAVIPLVFLTLGLVPGLAGPWTAWLLFLGSLAVNAWLYRKELRRPVLTLVSVRRRLSPLDRWFFLLAGAILVLQLSPLSGLWVTPGDDAKLYSLITQRFIDTSGIPQTWGILALPSWYVERTHLLIPGFSATAASLSFVVGGEIPAVVSTITSVYRGVPALSLFVLVFVMTRRKEPALLTLAIYGLLIVEPIVGWFGWGGMAELGSISLLPLAAAGLYAAQRNEERSLKFVLWLGIVVGGMSLLHPFAFFYLATFLAALTALLLWKLRLVDTLWMWAPIVVGLALAAPVILHAFGSESAVAAEYSAYNPGWTPVASWSMSPADAAASLMWRMNTVYGPFVVLLLVLGIALWREVLQTDRMMVAALMIWLLGMLFLHENNPNGLWLVPFPLWYRLDANRTFGVTSFMAAPIAALILERAYVWLFPFSARPMRPSLWGRLREILRTRRRAVVLVLLVGLALGQVVANATMLYGARTNSPVTSGDIAAFAWIQERTPSSATFFVNQADAGTWIPAFAGRRVVMPFGVVTNYSLLDQYSQVLATFSSSPSSPVALAFMNSTGATYVYAGPTRIYGREGFDPARIAATGAFETIYHREDVWIFELNGARSALTSPARVPDTVAIIDGNVNETLSLSFNRQHQASDSTLASVQDVRPAVGGSRGVSLDGQCFAAWSQRQTWGSLGFHYPVSALRRGATDATQESAC